MKTTNMKTHDANQSGHAHLILPIVAILTIASVGTYVSKHSFTHADQAGQTIIADDGNDDDSGAQALLPTGVAARQVPAHKFYHLGGSQKRVENSVKGLNNAKNGGYEWIDLDAEYVWTDASKTSRTMINTHWGTVGKECFVDPDGKIPLTANWSDLTLAQAERLQSGAGTPKSIPKNADVDIKECTRLSNPYKVRAMTDMLKLAAQRGLSVELEVKSGGAFNYPSTYKAVATAAQQMYAQYGTVVWVKTLDTLGGGVPEALKRLNAAHNASFKTLLLNHSNHVVTLTRAQATYVDFWRGSGNNAVKESN